MMTNTPELNKALSRAKVEFPRILANRRVSIPTKSGKEISFTYAELEEIGEAITPALTANGLCLSSQMRYLDNGKYCLVTTLRHESGEFLESFFPLVDSFGDAKDLGGQISYGRRYNVLCLLEISTVEPSNDRQWQEKKRKIASELQKEVNNIPPRRPDSGGVFSGEAASPPPAPPPPPNQIDRDLVNTEIDSLLKRKFVSIEDAKAIVKQKFGYTSRQMLNDSQLVELLELLRLKPTQKVS